MGEMRGGGLGAAALDASKTKGSVSCRCGKGVSADDPNTSWGHAAWKGVPCCVHMPRKHGTGRRLQADQTQKRNLNLPVSGTCQ